MYNFNLIFLLLDLQTIFCAAYVSIVYKLSEQPTEWPRYFMFLVASLLISFIAHSIGLVVVTAINAQNNAFLALAMSMIFITSSGFFVSFSVSTIFAPLMSLLTFSRYGFEATVLAIFSFGRENLPCYVEYCHFKSPEILLDELGILRHSIESNIIGLVIILLVLRILAYISLSLKLRSSKKPLLNWKSIQNKNQ